MRVHGEKVGYMEGIEKEPMDRRQFLLWSAAAAALLLLPGCDDNSSMAAYDDRTEYRTGNTYYPTPQPVQPVVQPVYVSPQPQYVVAQQPRAQAAPVPQPMASSVTARSRSSWGATPATPARMKAMDGISRVTVHHEGNPQPNYDNSPAQVASTLRGIQAQHRQRMGAGDIGYHYIVDRSGGIWQGRDSRYQGAHSSGNNAHNLGILVLGNFDIQQPTAQQISTTRALAYLLMKKNGLSKSDLYVHSDLCSTRCPGNNMRNQVSVMRRYMA